MKKLYFLLFTLFIAVASFGQTPIITAILDGDCSGGNPKLLEIYADGAVDFSLYSLENQTNANTTWGSTTDLSALGIVTDGFVYITTTGSTASLASEFPSLASANTLTSGVINLNGDDRIRIIETATSNVIDIYGVDGTDGTGENWEYADSYAKRADGAGPSATFAEADWTFPGSGVLNNLGTCQGGTDTFETLIGGVGTYSTTASTTPNITISGSVTSLDYFENNGPSTEQSFNVSGSNLTQDITITAPTNFEVATMAAGPYAASTTLTQTSGSVAITPIYVRLAAGLTSNTYMGDLTASSMGATDQTLALTGTVSPDTAQITVTAFLNSFDYTEASTGPSAEQTFTVEGLFLTSDITVTAPTNYEVSLTTGAGFASSVSATQVSGTVASTTIYVRLAGGLTANSYTGDITVSATGVTDETIALSGNVFGVATNSLVLTGVYDGPLTGGAPKGVEITALADIADLSLYGIGTANNGDGTDGQEFTFPAVALSAGDIIYVSNETTGFTSFFGFAPDYTDGSMGINGDDAIELFENGVVIDTFGDINTDGTGETWEYTDGWAYRNDDTGPDGAMFVEANWSFSGTNELEGGTTNATTSMPFPIASYMNSALSNNNFETASFSLYPNPTNTGAVTINTTQNGAITVNVFDILGKQVKNETITNNTLDVSNLKSGIYLVKISQNNTTSTKKLIIK